MLNSLLSGLSKKISELYHQNVDYKTRIMSLEEEFLEIESKNEEITKKLKKMEVNPHPLQHYWVKRSKE